MEEVLAVTQPLFCWNQLVCAGSTSGCSSAPVPRALPRESHQWACWQSNGISWTCSTVVGPNALIQLRQTVPGRSLPALVPPFMGVGRGQHRDDSLVVSGVMSSTPLSCPAARSPSPVFCISVPGFGFLYIQHSEPVKCLSNLGKMS